MNSTAPHVNFPSQYSQFKVTWLQLKRPLAWDITLHPLWDLKPDFFFGVSDEAMLRLDILSWHKKKLELLQGSDQHDGGLHVGKTVGRALTPPSKPKRREGDCWSALALLLGESLRVEAAGVWKTFDYLITYGFANPKTPLYKAFQRKKIWNKNDC